ncbi:MAG: Gfo/Idh/MocA family oxidoreductase [Isosphaeraceae bacterium]|nr:Gfo/Idh/MocA family oxidoreductase [Isosphaeraceae bacterium]
MPPISLNRRRFLGCSAAAGLALGTSGADGEPAPVRLGFIGLGNRGTSLLRAALEAPAVSVSAIADLEPRHRTRAAGIVEKATGRRPDECESWGRVLERDDVDAVVVALPCDLHAAAYSRAIRAGKHLYAEKPLAPTLQECDRLIAEAASAPEVVVHVGYQRRSNPRFREIAAAIARGEIGEPLTGSAAWISGNPPSRGQGDWLTRRERSGDWMVEQSVHVFDLFHWFLAAGPNRASGRGRRDILTHLDAERDVTDDFQVLLFWENGFRLDFHHSRPAPPDQAFLENHLRIVGRSGGIDLATGLVSTYDRSRGRRSILPGIQPDTQPALEAFFAACRAPEPPPPPITLAEAREATRIGLLVRAAIDHDGATVDDRAIVESASDPAGRAARLDRSETSKPT